MKVFATLVAGIGFLGLVPLSAQDSWEDKREREQGRKVLMEFSKCAAKNNPELARRYVLLESGERLSSEEWQQLVDPACMRLRAGKLTMDQFYFRGALAQQLQSTDETDWQASDFTEVAPLKWKTPVVPEQGNLSDEAYAMIIAAHGEKHDEFTRQIFVKWVGECIARANPSGVRSVLVTRIDSKEERGAMQALGQNIVACVPAGNKVAINRTNLRTGLAIAYFRLADAQVSAVGGVPN